MMFCLQSYRIYYTQTPSLATSLWTVQSVGNVRTASLSNLPTNRTFSLSISAFTVEGEGPTSDPIQVSTQPGGKNGNRACFS